MHLRQTLSTFAALASLAALSLPAAAQNSVPSYAMPGGETIHGTIASVNGSELTLRDDRGFVDRVAIHAHVAMHPADLQLAPDESVTIVGHADGRVFIADEIALTQSGPAAYGDPGDNGAAYAPDYAPDYAPAPIDYPYPYYYPYYPYGASIGFFFGGGYGHYHGYRGGYPRGGYGHGGFSGGGFSRGGFTGRTGAVGGSVSRGVSTGGGHSGGGRR